MSEQLETKATDISINDAHQHVGERVRIRGWLYNLRKSGKIQLQ